MRPPSQRVLLAQGSAVAVHNRSGLISGGDLLAHLHQRVGVAADQLEGVRVLGAGLLAQDRQRFAVHDVGCGRVSKLQSHIPKMAAQIAHRPAAFALNADLAFDGRLVGDAGGLELAEPLQREAEVVAQGEGARIVGAKRLRAVGIQPTQRTGNSLRDSSRRLLIAEVVERLRQPDEAIEGAFVAGPVDLLVGVNELLPARAAGLQLADLAELPGQAAQGVERLVGLRTQAAVLCFVQPGIGAPGVGVGLHLAQDAGQALESPDRVRLVGADRAGPGVGQLAEEGRGATQIPELLLVPGQVADCPQRGRMLGAQDLLAAVEELHVDVVGPLVIAAATDRVGQARHGVERGDIVRPAESR